MKLYFVFDALINYFRNMDKKELKRRLLIGTLGTVALAVLDHLFLGVLPF